MSCVCRKWLFFFFKQKTAYEMRISDWSSDVCSSDLVIVAGRRQEALDRAIAGREHMAAMTLDIGDAGAIEDFARRAIAEHPDLNVLINNAGIMRFESLDRRSDQIGRAHV